MPSKLEKRLTWHNAWSIRTGCTLISLSIVALQFCKLLTTLSNCDELMRDWYTHSLSPKDLGTTAFDVLASSSAVSPAITSSTLITNMDSKLTRTIPTTNTFWLAHSTAPAGLQALLSKIKAFANLCRISTIW